MKGLLKGLAIFCVLLVAAYCAYLLETSNKKEPDEHSLSNWEIFWTNEIDDNISEEELEKIDGWIKSSYKDPAIDRPYSNASQWIRFQIPQNLTEDAAIFLEKIYGYKIIILLDNVKIYESNRDFNYEINSILIPLAQKSEGKYVYIGIDSNNRIGIQKEIRVGEYYALQKSFVESNITDFILGSSLIFIAVVMLICSMFLNSENIKSWLALCIVILSSGVIVITYSSFLYSLFSDYGKLFVTLFDLSLFVLLPAFTYFFECIFGHGFYSIISRYRKFQVFYSVFCVILMIIDHQILDSGFFEVYRFASATLLGYIMIVQFILLVSISTLFTIKGNIEAIIFSTGFAIFAVMGLGELLWFYSKSAYYDLYLWKWGVVCFLISLIIILGRRFAINHQQVVEYSKQLEMFNNELQRSEKMEIISELAASVAHEVRNPLQVTRGFIQLLNEKQENADKLYLTMALDELDRASNIITDFLTFAKPEVGKISILNLLNEFIHIEGILVPMANLQGGRISVNIPNNLFIRGNSSKFKQASINIIKNSIEALNGDGDIHIWAYKEKDKVFIHIKDTGEGMDEEVLARLGEPYFSNKTKGTGLGLMVTFRIIEVMQGEIQFKSKKGTGTEVVIRFPSAENTEEIPT